MDKYRYGESSSQLIEEDIWRDKSDEKSILTFVACVLGPFIFGLIFLVSNVMVEVNCPNPFSAIVWAEIIPGQTNFARRPTVIAASVQTKTSTITDTFLLGLAIFLLTFSALHAFRYDSRKIGSIAPVLIPKIFSIYLTFVALILLTAHIAVASNSPIQSCGFISGQWPIKLLVFLVFLGQLLIDLQLFIAFRHYTGMFPLETGAYKFAFFAGLLFAAISLAMIFRPRSDIFALVVTVLEVIIAIFVRTAFFKRRIVKNIRRVRVL